MSSGVKIKAKSTEDEKRERIRETETLAGRKAEQEEGEGGEGSWRRELERKRCSGIHGGSNEWAMRERVKAKLK